MKTCSFLCIIAIALVMACDSNSGFDRDLTQPGAVCKVHNIPLQNGVVPIEYGLTRFTEEDLEAESNLFPHANSTYLGGCVVRDAKRARVSFCPECRKAEAVWKEHQRKVLAPIESHLERVRSIVHQDQRYGAVHPYLHCGAGGKILGVGLEGSVKTEADLADLRRLVEETNPPEPVQWAVRVGPKEP